MNEKMRLVDANALKRIYEKWLLQLERPENEGDRTGVEACLLVLNEAPTIEAKPVQQGYWKFSTEKFPQCSVCEEINPLSLCTAYCSSCGAKMTDYYVVKEN